MKNKSHLKALKIFLTAFFFLMIAIPTVAMTREFFIRKKNQTQLTQSQQAQQIRTAINNNDQAKLAKLSNEEKVLGIQAPKVMIAGPDGGYGLGGTTVGEEIKISPNSMPRQMPSKKIIAVAIPTIIANTLPK